MMAGLLVFHTDGQCSDVYHAFAGVDNVECQFFDVFGDQVCIIVWCLFHIVHKRLNT